MKGLETQGEGKHNIGIYNEDLAFDAKLQKEEEKMAKEEKEVVAQKVEPIVMPVVSPEEALKAWKKYEELKAKIVTKEDVQKIQGKDFLKKSYWRKIATFFNLSLECVKEDRTKDDDGTLTYCLTYKAIAPNGRFAYGDGACSSDEKGLDKTEHNTRAIAHTRAFNRAVSNLVGGGEVSAEEINASMDKPEALKGKTEEVSKPQGDLTEVLQFGKYKGKSLEVIHQEDSQYLGWLCEQDWFNEAKWNDLRDKVQIFLDAQRFEDLPDNV